MRLKTNLIYLCLLINLIYSNLWGYETEWQDNKLGPSIFKIQGFFWFGYENIDVQKGNVDSGTKQGFTMNRSYIILEGLIKEGNFKNWKYNITIDGTPGEKQFIKFAYLSIPFPFSANLILGLQQTPTVNAGRYSLLNLWGRRYLDADGKAMWSQLEVTTSSDLGIGFEQNTDFYQINLLVGNGEGYKLKNNAQQINNTSLKDLAKGSEDSYGLYFYGKFSITPVGAKEDLPTRFFFNIPFVLRNIYGIQRAEYEYLDTLNFTAGKFTFLKGDPTAKRDYAYGLEADLLLNLNDLKIGIGAGQIIGKDIRRAAIKLDQNLLTTPLTIANFYNYYKPAKDSIGVANYVFLWAQYQKFGIVFRHYINTDNATISDKLNYSEGLSVAEQLLIQDASNGILGDQTPEQALQLIRSGTVDEGKSIMKTYLLAIEYYMNQSFKMAFGIKQATTSNKDGTPYKVTPFQASNIGTYTSNSFSNLVATQLGLPSIFLDTDIIGTKKINKQIFFRSQFTY